MLTNVPTQMRRSGRLVTLKHPNAMDCTVWRKTVLRPADSGTMGGLPNVGGMGLLDAEDEADYDYTEVGDAKIVFIGVWTGEGSNWNDADTGLIYPPPPQEALIECVLDPSDPNFFTTEKPDRISVEPGGGIVLVFEVAGESGNVMIPPYTRKYILTARSDSEAGIG